MQRTKTTPNNADSEEPAILDQDTARELRRLIQDGHSPAYIAEWYERATGQAVRNQPATIN